MQARPDIQNFEFLCIRSLIECDANLPIALAQCRLQLGQNGQARADAFNAPLILEDGLHPLEIASGDMHIGFLDLDHHQPRGGVHGDRFGGGGFAHHLAVDLAFGGDIDHDIALHTGLAAKTPPFFQPAHTVITRLDLIPLGQGVLLNAYPVFGEIPVGGRDLAFGTDTPPATDRIEIDA